MFEEFRINRLLKKEIKNEIYEKLPIAIKNDARIVEKFIADDPNNINYVSNNIILEMVAKDYSLCKYLDTEKMNDIFSKLDISQINIDHDLFGVLNPKNRYIVLKELPKTYFNLIPDETLAIEFPHVISNVLARQGGYFSEENGITSPEQLREILLSLSPEKIILIAERGTLNSEAYVKEVIKSLSIEEQLELYNSNDKFFDYLPLDIQEDVLIHKCNNDINKILELPDPIQIKYFSNNPEQLKFASRDIIGQVFEKGGFSISAEQFREITYDKGYRIGAYVEELEKIMPQSEILKLLSGGSANFSEYIWSSRYNPDFVHNLRELVNLRLSSIEDIEKKEEFVNVFSFIVQESRNVADYDSVSKKVCGMFLDDKIIKTVEPSMLLKYAQTEDKAIFIDILSNAYGEHVREIFNKRPMLTSDEIPTFKIFDKQIVDNLGIEFVNYILTYNYNYFDYELTSIATDPEQMITFKQLWDYTISRCDKVDSETIYDIMNNFALNKELLSKLDFASMSEKQKEMLDLYLNESENTKYLVHSEEDLDNYLTIRNEFFRNIMVESESISDKQNIIFEYMTGRNVNPDVATIENMGISDVVRVFNINNIVKNPKLVDEIGMTSDEVALLLLVNQVRSINNPQVLDDVFLAISHSKELNPVNFKSTFDKISDYYIDKFKSDLTDSRALEQMPQTIVDGIPVVSFEGEPFNMLCSVTGMNLSMGLYSSRARGETLLDDWLNLENGMSTISCGLCCSNVCVNPMGIVEGKPNITFVFDKDVDIVGMGGSDIASSHTKRDPKHRFEYIGHNKMKYATMDEIKKDTTETLQEMLRTGWTKFPNEVSILRREEDIRKVEQSQQRTMPIGLYVTGEITEEVLQTAKMFGEYYKSHNLGEFRIIKVNPEKYFSTSIYDYVQTPKEKIESNVSWYQDAQEQINKGRK